MNDIAWKVFAFLCATIGASLLVDVWRVWRGKKQIPWMADDGEACEFPVRDRDETKLIHRRRGLFR